MAANGQAALDNCVGGVGPYGDNSKMTLTFVEHVLEAPDVGYATTGVVDSARTEAQKAANIANKIATDKYTKCQDDEKAHWWGGHPENCKKDSTPPSVPNYSHSYQLLPDPSNDQSWTIHVLGSPKCKLCTCSRSALNSPTEENCIAAPGFDGCRIKP